MTAQEKKDIYRLLEVAAGYLQGYKAEQFKSDSIVFADDVETKPEPAEPAKQKLTLDTLAQQIHSCNRCPLGATRINTVPGEGVPHPVVLVVGEGPGEQEDKSGRPFVGPAGQLLDKMLAAISLSRTANCYIANIVKCRPPHNRTPVPAEAEACSAFLTAQIHLLKPKIILAMGSTAVKNLLNTPKGIMALRGQFFDYNGIPLTATYHPSALLHDATLKRPAWEDLKLLRSWLNQNASGYDAPFLAETHQQEAKR